MKFCRIDLSATNYNTSSIASVMSMIERDEQMDRLQGIYKAYCQYKNFQSVVPLFTGMILDRYTDVIAYYPEHKLAAFSLIRVYDRRNVESLQFAWDYKNPDLQLGLKSLEHECAYYKSRGFRYLYLGTTAEYKKQLQGYEELGNPYV
jgi:hypothetical protein